MKHNVTRAVKQGIMHVNARLRESKFKLVGVKKWFWKPNYGFQRWQLLLMFFRKKSNQGDFDLFGGVDNIEAKLVKFWNRTI